MPNTIYSLVVLSAFAPAYTVIAVPAQKQPASVDGQVETFLATLKAGKEAEAVQTLMASSPLWAKHPGFSEQMIGQIDAAVKAYGPIMSYERIDFTNLGTMAIREYYFVQHRDMITRWEFDFVKAGNGWSLGYFGFSDQPHAWFP